MSAEIIAHMNALAAKFNRPTDPDPVFTFQGRDITGPADIDNYLIPPDAHLPPPRGALHSIMDQETPDPLAPLYIQPPDLNGPLRPQNPIETSPLDFRRDIEPDQPLFNTFDAAPNDLDLDDLDAPSLLDDNDLSPSPECFTDPIHDLPIEILAKLDTFSPPEPPRCNLTRSRKPPDRLNLPAICSDKSDYLSAYHITARGAMKEIPHLAEPAILLELSNLLKKKVFTGRHVRSLSKAQQASIIRSAMNVTQKVAPTSDGSGRTKDKVKARLVGGGDGQDRNHYTRADTSFSTVSISAIFIIAQLAAAEQRTVVTLDIGSAYLNAAMPKDDPSKSSQTSPLSFTSLTRNLPNSAPTMDHSSLNLIKHSTDASRAPYSGTRNSPHSP